MGKFHYEFTGENYVVEDCNEQFVILEIEGYETALTKRYRELLSQKHDLERAVAYLDQMFFKEDSNVC